ncbi:Josephin-domain-containing protein [Lactarius deliciosus]|nr:Josephin-domain-containing protein [Lactarius deliciosus]
MAGLEDLTNHVYHEKQESGSMLCAQHALNSLLQGSYFTPSDLSTIAQSLDSLEQRVDQGRVGRESANMDDTGFFSVQVLENALNVWGQSLIRWRSEVMQPYHNQPQNQRAFILNYDQHWFTLRRFGNSEGAGYWFNLNSFLDRPEWIGETYLGMVLQQAEAEGYSTFVVMPTDPDHPLPQTDGDVIATTLPPPASSGSQHLSTVHTPQPPAGLEDEDLQLQAALQASLGEAGEGEVSWKRTGSSVTTGGVNTLTPSANMGFPSSSLLLSPPPIPPPSTRPAEQSTGNTVATSMARNQALLERMRREQEAALREHYHDEVADLEDDRPHRSSLGARNTVGDEDEQLRRAIAESAELAREQGLTETDDGSVGVGVDPEPAYTGESTQGRPRSDRVYDDEDPELQAALQASLGEGPPEFFSPDSSSESSPFAAASMSSASAELSTGGYGDDDGEGDAATEETGSDTGERPQPPGENISIEEMRRRRLERFGG